VTGASEVASGDTRPIIEVRGVTHAYGNYLAVRHVDFVVPERQFVAIVGESGCGKTTTLKMINRLIEPDSGEILIDGLSTNSQPAHLLRRQIGYVFQRIGLFPHMTIAENIGITPVLSGWPRARIDARVSELLDLVCLPSAFASRFPAELSGGQRQRVGVARALAAKPRIMLMDEPFGALDPLTRDGLSLEFQRLHTRMGLTTLMVTHDMLEALLLADRILVMRAGKIIADGTPRELLNSPDEVVNALVDVPRRQALRVAELLEKGEPDG